MELKANCKINLGLRVLRRRADGFHDIETVMYPVAGLYDRLTVIPHLPGTVLTVAGFPAECPFEENICVRALRLLQRDYGIGEARIELHKTIPVGAGLGGGSADGAFTLRALDGEYSLGLSDDILMRLAAELGSDVPFFIRNTPQLCTGRGEKMGPIEVNLAGKWLVIVKPEVSVSTAEAYSGIVPSEDGIRIAEAIGKGSGAWRGVLSNDFEGTVFAKYPVVGRLRDLLYDSGAVYASMSGSGSAVFGLFDDNPPPDLELDVIDSGAVFFHREQLA